MLMDKKTVSGASGKFNPCLRCKWDPAHCSWRQWWKSCRPQRAALPALRTNAVAVAVRTSMAETHAWLIPALLTPTESSEDCWEGHSRDIGVRSGHASGIAKHETKPRYHEGVLCGWNKRNRSTSKAGIIVAEYIFFFLIWEIAMTKIREWYCRNEHVAGQLA